MSVDLGAGMDAVPIEQSGSDLAALEQMMTATRPPRRSAGAWADLLASRLSDLLQPSLGIPAGLALIGAVLGAPDRLRWALLVPALMGLVPVAGLLLARATGRIRTLRPTGRPRVLLLAAGTGYEIGVLVVLAALGAPTALGTALGGGVLALCVLAVLQLATDVSVRTSALTLVAGTLLPVAPAPAAVVAALAVPVGWSRVRAGAHTRAQAWLLPALVGVIAALAVATAAG
ncbi:MAG TPA: hypothetical protein VGC67_04355 [Cellulomonas sp.]